jgi:hypothetical protein
MSELAVRQRGDRAVFGVVFLMLFAFSYSEQLVSGLFPVVGGGGQTAWRVTVVVVDVAVLGLVGLMKGIVTRADGDAPRLWGWWSTGVAILIAVDVLRLIPLESIRVDVLTATVYAAAMGLTMAASLNADPLALFSTARRVALPADWARVRAIVPLVFGTWLCYLAASAFVDYFDVRGQGRRTADNGTDGGAVSTMRGSDQPSVLPTDRRGAAGVVADPRYRVQLLPWDFDRRRPARGDRGHRDGDGRRSGRRALDAPVGWPRMR